MAAFRTSRTFDVIFLLAVAVLVVWAYFNRIAIGDQVFFLGYTPDAKTRSVATAAGLTPDGTRLLYRTNPQFTDKEAVAAECDIERLGCLSSHGQTFVLDDPHKPNQTMVTAAHEMLHLAYRRLPQSTKNELAPLLDEAISRNSISIEDELRGLTTPEDRRDEAHSLLGTEYKRLPAELENYYKQYFTDRTTILTAAQSED